MRIEIIYGRALENGASPLHCTDCLAVVKAMTDAVAVLYFGRTRIPLCLAHLTAVERNVAAQVERLSRKIPS